jgi:ATP-dependent DNA helicase RecG
MTAPRFDLTPFLRQDEGQHYDRKSLWGGPDGEKRPRDRRAVRDCVAEYVAAFANAEGGVLVLGIEDDGTLTGHAYPEDAVRAILQTPHARLKPPQPEGFVLEHGGHALLVFDVPASDVPVQVDGDGFPLRMGDRTVQATESQVQALKFRGLAESWEARPSRMALSDLDPALLQRARAGAGLPALSDEEYLCKRKLADRKGRGVALRRAAELLFAKDGPDHPNAGVRVFRVIGSERRYGVEHNVEERPRIEGNLPHVLHAAFSLIEGLIRRPSRLVGSRFREVPEYPEFSWKEAVLNAAAHRDYSVEGRTTEVWFFDDRLEVTSPGGLVPDVTVEELLEFERVHVSRNPRLVRALVDLDAMRDQGEGIPRMFSEMEGLFLPAPMLESSRREFRLTLRNTPTLTPEDREFVAALGEAEISDLEFRALLEVHRRGRVDNARLRQMSGLDTLSASQVLRRLRDRGLLALHAAGAASFYELGPAARAAAQAGTTDRGGFETPEGADRGGFEPDRGGFEAPEGSDRGGLEGMPEELRRLIGELGPRPRQARVRQLIVRLAALRPWSPAELAGVLGLADVQKLVERHLSPMVKAGQLERTHPDNPAHPRQAYRTRQNALPMDGGENE